jgi:hypothetical protein
VGEVEGDRREGDVRLDDVNKFSTLSFLDGFGEEKEELVPGCLSLATFSQSEDCFIASTAS